MGIKEGKYLQTNRSHRLWVRLKKDKGGVGESKKNVEILMETMKSP